MGSVISIINMKGGVGKTTLSVGIADFLSEKGKKILFIDADPQFNGTQAFLDFYYKNMEEFYENEVRKDKKTIYSLFRLQNDMTDSYETPSASNLLINLKDNLDILCGDLNLVLVNKVSDHTFVSRLRNFIKDNCLKEKYDYIIIDCPPTLTIYTDSALMASDFYLIPNRIDRYSIIGIASLQKAVKSLIRAERIDLKCLGLVYTMVSNTGSAKQEALKTSFESKEAVNGIDIFSSKTGIVNNLQYGKSGTIPTQYQSSKEDIEAISLEFLDKIEKYKE
ncbi:chromosome partitioning protein ParA [Megasphaera cerevisiae DSM 20462]|uniref:Chromosome partitioning protein ParA n=1 Tax=Megasphaera cerevisiae DSM 20462 TaxID=1122219 RepID=A0A0J6WW97_9FIRM|nr:AAA family ATPase [Megasphaera cerevisiae]KMO86864.1 chromosome partitioning protein ParA [Megasphaera cerevisiae DSM 20462]SJZ83829.1 chromosome partitioning protein [Megasphaera cerevisiae DSM 20462]